MFVKIGHAKVQWKTADYKAAARTMRYPWFIILEFYLFVGLCRVGHDWATELNWICWFCCLLVFILDGLEKNIVMCFWCPASLPLGPSLIWVTALGMSQASVQHYLSRSHCESLHFSLMTQGSSSPSECRTHNWWTIQTLERGQLSKNEGQEPTDEFLSLSPSVRQFGEKPFKGSYGTEPLFTTEANDHEKHTGFSYFIMSLYSVPSFLPWRITIQVKYLYLTPITRRNKPKL